MGICYKDATTEERSMLEEVMSQYHRALVNAGATVFLKFAFKERDEEEDEPETSCLKVGGYPVAAKVKINSLDDRSEGKMDATITVDFVTWRELNNDRRKALLDHELSHLIPKYDGDGILQRDDLGRPKLQMRKHDIQLGIFLDVVDRHQQNAMDTMVVMEAHQKVSSVMRPLAMLLPMK
jgi:hypothetical protein